MDFGIELATKNKTQKNKNKFWKIILLIFLFIIIFVVSIILTVQFRYHNKIISGEKLDDYNVALVFGAGLKKGGLPSDILADRLKTAIQLYQDSKVKTLILSGDNSSEEHQEVMAMKKMALEFGLPEDALIEDSCGLDTFASCARVKSEFSLSKIILITQKYHLRRALYLCNSLGIDAYGVPAIDRGYVFQRQYNYREILASLNSFFEINFLKRKE
ncbi:MAG: ElyC/SanA/YdcF family protein [Patescibacteria group bacterium]